MAAANATVAMPSKIRSTPMANPMNQMPEIGICASRMNPSPAVITPEKTSQPHRGSFTIAEAIARKRPATIKNEASTWAASSTPEFDIAAECAPFLERVMLAHYAPRAVMERSGRALSSTMHLLEDLPRGLNGLLSVARQGKLQAQIEVASLSRLGNQVDRAASRLTVGIVTASLVIGSSIVLAAGEVARASGLHWFGLLGFAGAGIGGIWLLISIWHDGKRA